MSQESRMRAILAKLELLAHGSVQAWNPSGGQSGEPDDKAVAAALRPDDFPHLTYRRMFDEAWGPVQREAAIELAEKEHERWVKSKTPADHPSVSVEELILEKGEGHAPDWVAQAFGVAVGVVVRLRRDGKRSIEDGRKLQADASTVLERLARVEKARELKAQGLSLRQIGMHLGVDAATVSRDLAA